MRLRSLDIAEAILRGEPLAAVGRRYGISLFRVRQLFCAVTRRLQSDFPQIQSALAEDADHAAELSLAVMHDNPDYWLDVLSRYRITLTYGKQESA